jgi:hypothetical protein
MAAPKAVLAGTKTSPDGARRLQLDLFVTSDHDRVDEAFALFVELVDQLRQTWPDAD